MPSPFTPVQNSNDITITKKVERDHAVLSSEGIKLTDNLHLFFVVLFHSRCNLQLLQHKPEFYNKKPVMSNDNVDEFI